MAQTDEGKQNRDAKQPFISKDDRPDLGMTLDTPLAELRVRELITILGIPTGKNPHFEVGKTYIKEFFDKPFPEVATMAKDRFKEIKGEKHELLEPMIDPRPDPRFDQVIQAMAGLTSQISQLTDQVDALSKRIEG